MDRERIKREIEEDSRALEPALSGLVSGISRPESLSAPALLRQLEERSTPVRRSVRWLRPLAASAAAVVVCAGALLAFWRPGFSSSISTENQAGAPQASSSPAMAAAGETAGVPEAMMLEDVAADSAEQTEAEDGAIKPRMAKEKAEDTAADTPPLKSALAESSLASAYLPGILQTEVAQQLQGKNLAQDEDYLYYLAAPSVEEGSVLYIVEDGDFQTMATIELQTDMQAQAVLVAGDRLALVSDETEVEEGTFTYNVRADIYDVEDRSDPKLARTIRQDGQLAASALQEGRLCLVSTCPAMEQEDSGAPRAPRVRDSLSQEEKALSEEELLLPEGATQPIWTVVTLLELSGEETCASLAVFGGTDSLLLEENAAYLAAGYSGEEEEYSSILSLSLEDGIPRQRAFVRLKGSLLLPQPLSPLQDGLLAALTQNGERCLYRLNASFSQVSELQP